MTGQAHMPRRRLVPLVVAALAVLALPAVGAATRSHSVAGLRLKDSEIERQSRAAVLGLYSIDAQLARADAHLADLHRHAAALRAQRVTLTAEIRVARSSKRVAQEQLARQIRALYEQGDVGPLEIVLGARNLDDALANIDSVNSASAQSKDILGDLAAAKKKLDAASSALARRQSALAEETREAEATRAACASTRAARTSYIDSLARQHRLTVAEIDRVVAAADAAQARSVTLAQPTLQSAVTPSEISFTPSPIPGRSLTVSATGYALPGRTATGLAVGYGIAAVDPSVIPLGTHMIVPGYGEAVAADTGTGIVGAEIDLWFPSVPAANAWGRRTVTIQLG